MIDAIKRLVEDVEFTMYRIPDYNWGKTSFSILREGPDKMGLLGVEVSLEEKAYGDRFFLISLYLQDEEKKEMKSVLTKEVSTDVSELEVNIFEAIGDLVKIRQKARKNANRRKYYPGAVITSFDDLIAQDLIYFHDKITARGWFMNWNLNMAVRAMKAGVIRYAMRKDQ